jgi:hypothetical protein
VRLHICRCVSSENCLSQHTRKVGIIRPNYAEIWTNRCEWGEMRLGGAGGGADRKGAIAVTRWGGDPHGVNPRSSLGRVMITFSFFWVYWFVFKLKKRNTSANRRRCFIMSRVSKSFRSWRPTLWKFFRQIIPFLTTKMLENVAVIWIFQLWIYRVNWHSKTRTFFRVCASFLQVNYPASAAASGTGSWRPESSLFRAITLR